MSYMTTDFACEECGCVFEDIWDKRESLDDWKGQVECPKCGSSQLEKLLSSPGLATYSMADREGRASILKKRSLEHSKKMMKRDMDKHRATVKKKAKALGG